MNTTKYDYNRLQHLKSERQLRLDAAREIVDRAKDNGRDLDLGETDAVEAAQQAVKAIDAELKDQQAAMMRAVLGTPESRGPQEGIQFLSLRRPGVKAAITSRFGGALGTPGMKSLLDYDDPYTTIPMDPEPYRIEQTPTSLLEILPSVKRPVVYRWMRQNARDNNATPVARGEVKPTSVFSLEPMEGRLHVIAHVSEPIDKYTLSDGGSLASFVQMEMVDGLHQAVEAQLLSGDGTGENLTGLAHTSGIQTQALVTDPILTSRAAITKVEVLDYSPYYFVMNPVDWERVETAQLDAGQYVLNAEGSRSGVPVDMAARRLWRVPVSVTTGVPSGTAYLLSSGVAQVATDGQLATEWSSATGDLFTRNEVLLRVEGRFDLAVTRPLGVVRIALGA